MPSLIRNLAKPAAPSASIVDTYYTIGDERNHLTFYNHEGRFAATSSAYFELSASSVPNYYEYITSSAYSGSLINYWPLFDSPNTVMSASNHAFEGGLGYLYTIGTPDFCTSPIYGTTTVKDNLPNVNFTAASLEALSGSTEMANIPSGSSRTYIMLFHPDVSAVTYNLFGTNETTNCWNVKRVSTSNRITVYMNDGTNTLNHTYTNVTNTTSYFHIAVVFERTGSLDTRVYVQGVEGTPKAAITDMGMVSGTINFQVARNSDGTNYYDGQMAHLQIYDTALTREQILQNYSSSAYLLV